MSTWIKRTDREPTQAEMPILSGHYCESGEWCQYTVWNGFTTKEPATHWRSIKTDPPLRELTQREKDEATAMELAERCVAYSRRGVVLEAIYGERFKLRNVLTAAWGDDWGLKDGNSATIRQLRARLDEQGDRK